MPVNKIRNIQTGKSAKKSIIKTKWKISKSQKMISLVENKKIKGLYNLSEPKVIAILELRLQKLTALGINEIEEEIKKLSQLIIKYKNWLLLLNHYLQSPSLSLGICKIIQFF